MFGMLAFVSALIAFQSYLIINALTSWEYLSWMNITYLKVWPRKYGSPFSSGSYLNNIKIFLNTRPFWFRQRHTKWQMPNKLPRL